MHHFRILLLSLACLPFAAQAQAPAVSVDAVPTALNNPANAGKPITREELPALVREVLMNEPEILKDAVQKLREKQEAEAKKKTDEALAKRHDDLFKNPDAPTTGDASADVTIVEFFDYHCGYCKHLLPTITDLLKEDKKVKIVFLEYPILSEDSVTAARAALAVNRIAKDKYFAFHTALMKAEGKFTDKTIDDVAKKVGVNVSKLKTEMAKQEITAILDKNREIGTDLGVSGTPGLVMGGELIPGAVPLDDLKKMVANIRAGKKPSDQPPPADKPAEAPAAPAAAPIPAPAAAPAEKPKG